jgi:hypothetical protein
MKFSIGSVFFGSCRFALIQCRATADKLKLILKGSKHCKNVLHSLYWYELRQISFKSLTDPEGSGVRPCLRHKHVELGFFVRRKSISVHGLNCFIALVRTSKWIKTLVEFSAFYHYEEWKRVFHRS